MLKARGKKANYSNLKQNSKGERRVMCAQKKKRREKNKVLSSMGNMIQKGKHNAFHDKLHSVFRYIFNISEIRFILHALEM